MNEGPINYGNSGPQPIAVYMPPQQPPRMRQPEQIIVPPRVQVAMQMISMLNQKTAPTFVAGGEYKSGADRMEGESLTPSELLAHTAACELVESYFAGKFIPDLWEAPVHKGIARRSTGKKKRRMIAHRIHCPECGAHSNGFNRDCPVCGGDGNVMLVRRRDL